MSRISAIMRAAFAACLIIGACSAAIAEDYESYKNSVIKLVEIWSTTLADLGRQLAPINDELSKLQQVQSPGPDETRRIAELEQKREGIRTQVDQAGVELNLNLVLIQPLVGAPKRELVVFPDWMTQIIKAKGIPLGNGTSIAPDVDFDFKAKKLKSVSIIVHW